MNKILEEESKRRHINNPNYPAKTKRLAIATSIEPGQSAYPCSLARLYTVG